jgi:hypothetical protein
MSAPESKTQHLINEINDAATVKASSLTAVQIDYWLNLAISAYSDANKEEFPETIIEKLDKQMHDYIPATTKPTAVCKSESLIKSFIKQVQNYDQKLGEITQKIETAKQRAKDNNVMTRQGERLVDYHAEKKKRERSYPAGDTQARFEKKKIFEKHYSKYIAAHNDWLSKKRREQAASDLAGEMDDNNSNNSLLKDITGRINNSPSKPSSAAGNSAAIQRTLKRKSTETKLELDNKLRESAMQKKKQEEEDREITNKYFQAATEAQLLKAELLRAKIALTRSLQAQNPPQHSENDDHIMNNNAS